MTLTSRVGLHHPTLSGDINYVDVNSSREDFGGGRRFRVVASCKLVTKADCHEKNRGNYSFWVGSHTYDSTLQSTAKYTTKLFLWKKKYLFYTGWYFFFVQLFLSYLLMYTFKDNWCNGQFRTISGFQDSGPHIGGCTVFMATGPWFRGARKKKIL